MRRAVLLLVLLCVASPALAVSKKCPPKCHHRKAAVACVKPATSPLMDALVQGFELSAGFRWQLEHDCPTLIVPDPPEEPRDPVYVGASINLPLSPRTGIHGAFDRDFTDAPRWQVRTWLSFKPFGGVK